MSQGLLGFAQLSSSVHVIGGQCPCMPAAPPSRCETPCLPLAVVVCPRSRPAGMVLAIEQVLRHALLSARASRCCVAASPDATRPWQGQRTVHSALDWFFVAVAGVAATTTATAVDRGPRVFQGHRRARLASRAPARAWDARWTSAATDYAGEASRTMGSTVLSAPSLWHVRGMTAMPSGTRPNSVGSPRSSKRGSPSTIARCASRITVCPPLPTADPTRRSPSHRPGASTRLPHPPPKQPVGQTTVCDPAAPPVVSGLQRPGSRSPSLVSSGSPACQTARGPYQTRLARLCSALETRSGSSGMLMLRTPGVLDGVHHRGRRTPWSHRPCRALAEAPSRRLDGAGHGVTTSWSSNPGASTRSGAGGSTGWH